MSFGIAKMSAAKHKQLFGFSLALMGALSFINIFNLYWSNQLLEYFFITAGTFGAMSIYGYTTKEDLTKLGSFFNDGTFWNYNCIDC